MIVCIYSFKIILYSREFQNLEKFATNLLAIGDNITASTQHDYINLSGSLESCVQVIDNVYPNFEKYYKQSAKWN